MVFIFIIPSHPGRRSATSCCRCMLGAKDVAFPRLNLLSFYLWASAPFSRLLAIVLGGVDTGWTFYTPYSSNVGRRSS
jgi:cytochrome c oxidase subunit 1